MAREFLLLVTESAYKTPKASPVVGTDSIYIRLDGGNAFKMRPRPMPVSIPYGGGVATDNFTVSDKILCAGTLTTKLYATQAKLLLGWAGSVINSGQTSPWTTTEPAGDLASMAVYHAVQRSDGTYKRRLYLGTKVDSWSLEFSEESQVGTLNLELSASTPQGNSFDASADPTATPFPAPTDVQLPTDPYLFIHSSGTLTMGSARSNFSGFRIASKNKLAKRWWANRFCALMRFTGRDTSLDCTHYYQASPDDRPVYEALTTMSGSVVLNNGSKTTTIGMQAANVFSAVEDQLPLSDLYTQQLTLKNQYDNAAGTDLTITVV
jgi:hypothetical protein